MESQNETAVIYDPKNNKLDFYIDGTLTSRSLFTAKMNDDKNDKPVKLYEYEVEFSQLKEYIESMIEYTNGVRSKTSSTNMRKKKAKKILRKIIENER